MNTNFVTSDNSSPLLFGEPAQFSGTYLHESSGIPYNPARSTTQYHIVVKRNDALYKTLNIINTTLSVVGVLTIVATFAFVCYGLLMMTEVFETVQIIKNQQVP